LNLLITMWDPVKSHSPTGLQGLLWVWLYF
jgi:hypothetical protein